MTIDEMIEFLQGCAQVGQPEFSQIEAALRAGQEMRDEIDAWWEAGTSDTRGLYEASNAWDAATKKGEG